MNPLTLAMLWALWCTLHSLLIAPGVKLKMTAILKKRMRFYRLFYNIFSIVTAAPLVYLGLWRSEPVIFAWQNGLRFLQLLMLILAGYLFIAGARNYDGPSMLGLRQIYEGDHCTQDAKHCQLEKKGILGIIRHPWYTGGIILVWARDIDTAGLAVNIVLSVYLMLGAWFEERKLTSQFGESYRQYQRQVSAFIPFKWLITRLGKK